LGPAVDAAAVVAHLRTGDNGAAPPAGRPAPFPAPAPAQCQPLPSYDDDADRPSSIARTAAAVRDLLEEAYLHEWGVRLSYVNSKGADSQMTVLVGHVSPRKVVVETVPSYRNQTLNLQRVQWARVLTEAEEDQLL
ncbi:MAG: hypothetical protein ACRD12_00900, partial [Acidimicrobiales bacterium]